MPSTDLLFCDEEATLEDALVAVREPDVGPDDDELGPTLEDSDNKLDGADDDREEVALETEDETGVVDSVGPVPVPGPVDEVELLGNGGVVDDPVGDELNGYPCEEDVSGEVELEVAVDVLPELLRQSQNQHHAFCRVRLWSYLELPEVEADAVELEALLLILVVILLVTLVDGTVANVLEDPAEELSNQFQVFYCFLILGCVLSLV